MGRKTASKPPGLCSFSEQGKFFAIADANGSVKIWDTRNGNLQVEWKDSNGEELSYCTCMKWVFTKKKRRRLPDILSLGTRGGDVLTIDVATGKLKWKSTACHSGGVTALSFANESRALHSAGVDGMVCELDCKSGELLGKFKASKGSIASMSVSPNGKLLAVASKKIHLFNLENQTEVHKFRGGDVQHLGFSEDGHSFLSSSFGDERIQVWKYDVENKTRSPAASLSMQGLPLIVEISNAGQDRGGLRVLSVSEKGVAYVWHGHNVSQGEFAPTMIDINSFQRKGDAEIEGMDHVFAAKLLDPESNCHLAVCVAYGDSAKPQFRVCEVTDSQKMEEVNETLDVPNLKKKSSKKRTASDFNSTENVDMGGLELSNEDAVQCNMNEPTMEERLASLDVHEDAKLNDHTEQLDSSNPVLPAADSVSVLLRQALHADDRALLLECLNTPDEKVIGNTVSMLNPSEVLKLFNSILPMFDSRGTIIVCIIRWIRCLLLKRSSCILSQDCSVYVLNSLYQVNCPPYSSPVDALLVMAIVFHLQLIESRISTFKSGLQLLGTLDLLSLEIPGEDAEAPAIIPAIYEDKDDSDGELTDAMETSKEEEVMTTRVYEESDDNIED
ncbi:WD repeat-containing protein 43 isoform X2 [Amborella trichopoda]|uniref:WD repeat-containing protein 43 isoform X2 n=1 Tax=Amborella trichopoda TaxID=13333 RepID=UPI0009BCA21D|nr:WD repeat-containing protein 43 isoform X2 [Amborella trichopoda]|eukprot:XP_020523730.1 WD repeat-containing protein 43 isoform X2 [Amborella trichopoda]